jgi:hypothetical protein
MLLRSAMKITPCIECIEKALEIHELLLLRSDGKGYMFIKIYIKQFRLKNIIYILINI